MTKHIFILFFLITLFRPMDAATYRFGSIKINDGLSDNQVNCIKKDSKGFIWFGNRNGLNRYDGSKIKVFQHDKNDSASISSNFIWDIFEAGDKRLWIKTFSGLVIFDPTTEMFIRSVNEELKKLGIDEPVCSFYIDGRKNIWVVGVRRIFRYDFQKAKCDSFLIDKKSNDQNGFIINMFDKGNLFWLVHQNGFVEERDYASMKPLFVYTKLRKNPRFKNYPANRIFVDHDYDLWMFSLGGGVCRFDRKRSIWTFLDKSSSKNRLNSNVINQITQDRSGLIWIATDQGGVSIYNKKTDELTNILQHDDERNGLTHNSLQCVYCDDLGIVWLGSFKQGANFYHSDLFKFEMENAYTKSPYNIPFNDVNVFLEDRLGNLWMGSNGSGLACKDSKTGKYSLFRHLPNDPNSLPSNVIVSLKSDKKGRIWIGTYLGGLSCFDGKRFTNFKTNEKDPNAIPSMNIWDIAFDPRGNMWVATLGNGVVGYDEHMNMITHLDFGDGELKSAYVMSLTVDYPYLIISSAGGVDTYDLVKRRFVSLFTFLKGEKEIVSEHVSTVFKDSRGLYWIGTLEGLNCYDPKKKELYLFTEKDGLPDNVIQTILEDEESYMWISTVKGICRVKVGKNDQLEDTKFVVYNERDGLQNTTLNLKAAIRTKDNTIYYGGPNGIDFFKPKRLKRSDVESNLVFTGLQIYNQPIQPGTAYNGRVVLDKSMVITDKITLRHNENFFSIGFADLNYFMSQVTHYLYKLDGVNSQWIRTANHIQQVSFTNLKQGNYTLLVKAVYKDGETSSNTAKIDIEVLPPWWLSIWAKLLYLILAGLLVLYFYGQFKKRMQINRERIEAEREHRLDEMKLQFFTNISHEFRTPLTLILTPLERLIDKTHDAQVRSQLELMRRNAKHLLTLVNQVLDFRKLERSEQQIVTSKGDLVDFAKELFFSFSEGFEKKDIHAGFFCPVKSLWVNFDQDKLQKILTNLLSNALKFTPESGEIKLNMLMDLQRDSRQVVVRFEVSDTGIGIAEEYQAKVFDSFYQVPQTTQSLQGSGIGLHLAKKLVESMSGTIDLKSEPDKGSTFSVTLPFELIEYSHSTSERVDLKSKVKTTPHKKTDGRSSIALIVEDNEDVRSILRDSLCELYQVEEAENGKEGLELAQELLPDIIITDLMMPVMDGFEMSKVLKEDIRTSHIPIILLTAKVSDEAKVSSLRIGIEDYITKPFNMETLLLKVQNIKNRQQSVHKKFEEKMEINTQEIQITSLDEKLIGKAIELVEENISNAEFSVEELSQLLHMSRVNLYKKMLSITGKTPIEFIRIIRLKRSLQLLVKSQLSIAEIAYEVGFNTPRYFSKYFKDEYKTTPSEYRDLHSVSDNTLNM